MNHIDVGTICAVITAILGVSAFGGKVRKDLKKARKAEIDDAIQTERRREKNRQLRRILREHNIPFEDDDDDVDD